MNRLVLIGNGFDLAHGLKTSYKNFIEWYWEEWGRRLLCSSKIKEDDGLCSFVLSDNVNLAHWSYVWGFHYQRQNPYEPWDPVEVVKIAMQDKEICTFTMSPLLLSICNSIESRKWVDIENDYYDLLWKYVSEDSNASKIADLNNHLYFLQEKLIEYLKTESNKIVESIDVIYDKINRPTRFQEIAVSSRRSIRPIDDPNPESVMLLSFNYTDTIKKYESNGLNTKVNYIHGHLEEPKSIIFGYGDEMDKGFKKLQKQKDSECLRHIKSIRYLESDNYRRMLEFIESGPFQVVIMGHSCGNSDRTLLNTLFEHRNCVSIKPYYYQKNPNEDNYIELVQNISRNFTDMKLMRDRVVNKEYCEPLTNSSN